MPRKKNPSKTAKPAPSSTSGQPAVPETPQDTPRYPDFPIVGIGASAGGLEAFEAFIKAIPGDSGMAYILVPHLDPNHVSILPDLLQKHTGIPVCQITDGSRIQPDSVYVIPPNKNLAMLNGRLQLMESLEPRGVHLPIDSFFRSLAMDQGTNAVCIILSGTGTDGTLGVKAIKGEAGMVMVQDIASARYDSMPRNAIATGLADYVLPPDQMPEQLIKYALHATDQDRPLISIREGQLPDILQKIYILLRTRTNHDFSRYKHNTICRRIERRMNVHQISDITDYVRYLQENDHEIHILFKELLIGVTNFFRDPVAFDILRDRILPALLKNKPDDYCIRVWTPGCSSGEEPYSIAIILHELMEALNRHFTVQIFGTDIDEDAVQSARAGLYPTSISVDVGPKRLTRYFTKEDEFYRINKNIREMLVFAPQNLIKDPPFTKLDLLCCRNLLIYLNAELQKQILPVFHYSLKPDGILFLGSSETIGPFSHSFAVRDRKWKIFRRKTSPVDSHTALELPLSHGAYKSDVPDAPETIKKAEELSAFQLVETILQQSDTPPCAIVDDKGDIIYIHGHIGKFLEPAEGRISVNILEMARPGLKKALADALQKVRIYRQETICRGLRIQHNGHYIFIDLRVKPILEHLEHIVQSMMMVVFQETVEPETGKTDRQEPVRSVSKSGKKMDAKDLEHELISTRENLQTTIEELQTSNEELKSTIEELQSTNEELQSTNEELETSKEELQSLNEESITVNAELQSRIDELSKTNDDMKNLLDSTQIATIFLDTDLYLRRFTPKATELINLRGTDIGRPISHFTSTLEKENLVEYANDVLDTLTTKEIEVHTRDQRDFLMRLMPYHTTTNVIDGVVITFNDITDRKRIHEALQANEEKYRVLFETIDIGVIYQDTEHNILSVNAAAERILGFKSHQMQEQIYLDIPWMAVKEDGTDLPGENHPTTTALQTGKPVKNMVMGIMNPHEEKRRWILVSAIPLVKSGESHPHQVYTIFRDITQEKQRG